MTKRVGIKNICLKSMHMPLDANPDVLAATAAKVAAAGLTLYGAGVIDMVKEAQVHQAFEYGKAAGLRLLVISPAHEMLPLVETQVKKYDISVAIHNHGPGDRRLSPRPRAPTTRLRRSIAASACALTSATRCVPAWTLSIRSTATTTASWKCTSRT